MGQVGRPKNTPWHHVAVGESFYILTEGYPDPELRAEDLRLKERARYYRRGYGMDFAIYPGPGDFEIVRTA